MNEQNANQRWLNNPERRVGRIQRLRTMAAAVGTSDSRYHDYKKQLESEPAGRLAECPGEDIAGPS
jgi:hypothetical protein